MSGLEINSKAGFGTSTTVTAMRFHTIHGSAIEISTDRTTAKLSSPYNCGASFGDKPVKLNEKVYLRFINVNKEDYISPSLGIGFTSNDPATLAESRPNILHPKSTGYWIQWVEKQCYENDKLLYYYVNDKGELHYGINGEEIRMFMPTINTDGPLWAVVQLFGGLREVQFVDPETLDGVSQPNHSQIDDGVKHPNHSQVEDKVIRPNHSQVTSNASGTDDLPPLRFHSVHGDYIQISPDRSTAVLAELFTSGVTFSDRPVRANEKVCLRFSEIEDVVRRSPFMINIGFTRKDPAKSVANFLNPIYEYWTKNVIINDYGNEELLYFYFKEKEELRYGIQGKELRDIMPGINTDRPLWAVIEFLGGLRVGEFVEPETLDRVRRPNHSQVGDEVRRPNHSQVKDDLLVNRIRSLSIEESLPASRYQNRFVPLNFHRTKGRNIKFYNKSGIAARLEGQFSQGYVFSAQPIRLGQTIVIQILAVEETNRNLAIGLTSCDPGTLKPQELPDDAGFLLDRPEYWVVHPDAANGLQIGDELGMALTRDGKVEISRNNSSSPDKVLHVDHTVNLWLFIDICGATQGVRVRISEEPVESKRKMTKKPRKKNLKKKENALMPSTSRQGLSECTICLENQVNSVVYKCGHMCMCYNCAMTQWKGKGSAFGKCPLCRGVITDVIRTYVP